MLRVCLLLLLAASLAACGARQVKTERKGRIITLTDKILDTGGTDTVRFGRLHSGEIAQLRLWLANETSGPVVIAKYGRSCGCTTLEYDNQPINAGDAQRYVAVHFDQQGGLLDLLYRAVDTAGGDDLVALFQPVAESLHLLAALGFGTPHEEP